MNFQNSILNKISNFKMQKQYSFELYWSLRQKRENHNTNISLIMNLGICFCFKNCIEMLFIL